MNDKLPETAPLRSRRSETALLKERAATTSTAVEQYQQAREIEALAGVGLRREYWVKGVETPLGRFSRRACALTVLGAVLSCFIFGFAAILRLSDTPAPAKLPVGDARTVMTHVFANFSGGKDAQFQAFFPQEGDVWRFEDAYTFGWRDANGVRQQVIILSYNDSQLLETDYFARTRSVDNSRQSEAVYRGSSGVVELRSLASYGSLWRGTRISNLMMLLSPNVTAADQQELLSHFISITAAEHRDPIPTTTPIS